MGGAGGGGGWVGIQKIQINGFVIILAFSLTFYSEKGGGGGIQINVFVIILAFSLTLYIFYIDR